MEIMKFQPVDLGNWLKVNADRAEGSQEGPEAVGGRAVGDQEVVFSLGMPSATYGSGRSGLEMNSIGSV